MNKELFQDLVNRGLDFGADFCDVFYEKKTIRKNHLINKKIDSVTTVKEEGVGIRIAIDDEILSSSTSDLDEKSLYDEIDQLNSLIGKERKLDFVHLNEIQKMPNPSNIIYHQDFPLSKKKDYLYKIDKLAREYSDKINQVDILLYEMDQDITVANSLGKLSFDHRMLTRLYINIIAKDGDNIGDSHKTYGSSSGFELLDTIDIDTEVKNIAQAACAKLNAISCPGGDMPVIIGNGFGAVILHEACGHLLEATCVAKGLSIIGDKKGKKIANEKVTLIDDGSIEGEWGTLKIDDEGNLPQKNILIENGILKNYLVDYLNSKKMNCDITGSGRRESYLYAPTSRMNNTYLKPGSDKVEDMIKDIKFGLYAKTMGGGSVDPATGDFNFVVSEAYLIENGKLGSIVKDVSLIGNALDILNNIVMVSDDLKLETGWCGSASGWVAVTCGQPTIKVSKILVGGDKID